MPYFDVVQPYDVVASEKVTVLRIEERVLHTLLQVDASFSERFFQMLVTKLSYHLHNLPIRSAISKINDAVQ